MRTLAPLAADHDLVITHGNGPQVGMLALESAHDPAISRPYGTRQARPIRRATPADLRARSFPAGSMGPKIDAACRFAEATGKLAAIGQLSDAQALLTGGRRHRHYLLGRGDDGNR